MKRALINLAVAAVILSELMHQHVNHFKCFYRLAKNSLPSISMLIRTCCTQMLVYILHLLANAVIVRLYAKKLLVLHIDDDDDESELHASKSISDAQVTRV